MRRAQQEATQEQLRAVQEWCRKVAARLAAFNYEQRRLALAALCLQVRVYRADHEPHYVITATPGIEADTIEVRTVCGFVAATTCAGG